MMVNRSKILIDGVFLGVNPQRISVSEHRVIATQEVPGREGDIQQDMGSSSGVITLNGKIFTNRANDKKNVLRNLRNRLMRGGTKQMTAEILNVLSTRHYLVEDFEYSESGGRAFEYDYSLTVKQYTATHLQERQVNQVNALSLNNALFTKKLFDAQPAIGANPTPDTFEKETGKEVERVGFFGKIWQGISSAPSTVGGWFL